MIEPIEANDHIVDATLVRKLLIEWGKGNFREFPWRMTKDPYYILMSEVMLHRTQARQVVPVYERFIEKYQTLDMLSKATKEELNESLYSLGLCWRIDCIYEMTNELMMRFNGKVPRKKRELLSLSGVSEYIAGAVRCFAWNLPEPIPDTNTVRIAGRLFGLEIKESSRRNSLFNNLITKLVDPDNPSTFNYAQLDLADKVCTRKREPDCLHCPLLQVCRYASTITNQ
ncbi:MAG: DNA-binding protein [bacterium]|nr:DNA-binding protein [bacterium]